MLCIRIGKGQMVVDGNQRRATPERPKWMPVTPSNKKKLKEAVVSTPLTFGTVWDNSF